MLRKLFASLAVLGIVSVLNAPAFAFRSEDTPISSPQVVSSYEIPPLGFHADFDDGTSVDCPLACVLWIDPVARWNFTVWINAAVAAVEPSGQCGGDLPPCHVMMRESHGDIRVWNGGCYYPPGYAGNNPCGSTASGKWQFIRSTWAGYGGYLNAADAPESVQDAKAREAWAGGRGCSHWSEC